MLPIIFLNIHKLLFGWVSLFYLLEMTPHTCIAMQVFGNLLACTTWAIFLEFIFSNSWMSIFYTYFLLTKHVIGSYPNLLPVRDTELHCFITLTSFRVTMWNIFSWVSKTLKVMFFIAFPNTCHGLRHENI